MKTVSMTVRVTPEQKALHLSQEYAEIERELAELKGQFPSRQDCLLVAEDPHSKTCRDIPQADYCPRCETTEPLAKKWKKVTARRYSTLKKIALLGSQH